MMENGQDFQTVGEGTMKNDIKIERYEKLKTGVHSELCTAE